MRLLGEALKIIAAFVLGCIITAILCSFLSAWASNQDVSTFRKPKRRKGR
jgi:hypothetical protein